MMENDDIFHRMFDKLDRYEERLNTTCTTIAKIDQRLCDFIDSVNKKDDEIKQHVERRYKNIALIFSSISAFSVFIMIAKTLELI